MQVDRPTALAPWIVVEGIDGSGKSTQAKLLAKSLRGAYTHVFDTPEGESIRQLFLESSVSPLYDGLLLLAAREAYHKRYLGGSVDGPLVTDRYLLSISTMQGRANQAVLGLIDTARLALSPAAEPDMTIVLDVPACVASARRVVARDRIEAMPTDFHEEVRRAFLDAAATEPRVSVVDGTGTVAEVHSRVLKAVAQGCPGVIGKAALSSNPQIAV